MTNFANECFVQGGAEGVTFFLMDPKGWVKKMSEAKLQICSFPHPTPYPHNTTSLRYHPQQPRSQGFSIWVSSKGETLRTRSALNHSFTFLVP